MNGINKLHDNVVRQELNPPYPFLSPRLEPHYGGQDTRILSGSIWTRYASPTRGSCPDHDKMRASLQT